MKTNAAASFSLIFKIFISWKHIAQVKKIKLILLQTIIFLKNLKIVKWVNSIKFTKEELNEDIEKTERKHLNNDWINKLINLKLLKSNITKTNNNIFNITCFKYH